MELSAKDQDKLMNILIGMKEIYNTRFIATFGVFEDLVKQQYFDTKKEFSFDSPS